MERFCVTRHRSPSIPPVSTNPAQLRQEARERERYSKGVGSDAVFRSFGYHTLGSCSNIRLFSNTAFEKTPHPSLSIIREQKMGSPFAIATSLYDYRALLEAGFDPNKASPEDGTTAVFHLWDVGTDVDYAAVLQLFLQHGADLDHIDTSGNTALLRSGSDALSLSLVKAGASICSTRPDNFHTSAVIVSAAKKGHVHTVKYIVESMGVSVDAYLGRGTALHHVLYSHVLLEGGGIVEGLASLVNYAGEVDARDFMGKTPLYLVYESVKCAGVLLDSGADPNLKIPRGFWFHRHVFDAVVHEKHGAEFEDGPMLQGRSWERVIHGVHYRSPKVIQLLLERGAGVDSVDSDGNTPLLRLLSHGALTRHALDVFNVLFSFGASCTLRNNEGKAVTDMPLQTHPLLAGRIDERARSEHWSRRRGMFLVLAKYSSVSNDSEWEAECGIVKVLASRGYIASEGFVRNIVEFI